MSRSQSEATSKSAGDPTGLFDGFAEGLADYNRARGQDSVESELIAARRADGLQMDFASVRRQCRTFGDLHRLVTSRYASFEREIEALEKETPSVKRFVRVCAAMRKAIVRSAGHQDSTVFMSAFFPRAFDLICQRPKVPADDEEGERAFLFSEDERREVEAVFASLLKAFDLLKKEAHREGWPYPVARPASGRSARIFKPVAGGLFEFVPDSLLLWRRGIRLEAGLFERWEELCPYLEDCPLDAYLDRELQVQVTKAALPLMKEAAEKGDPEILRVKMNRLVEAIADAEAKTADNSGDDPVKDFADIDFADEASCVKWFRDHVGRKYERFEICAEEKGDGFYLRDAVRARRKGEGYVYHRMTAPKKMRVVLHLLKHLVEQPGEFMESVRGEGWKDAFPQGQIYRTFKDDQILNPKEANGVFSNRWRFWTKKEVRKNAHQTNFSCRSKIPFPAAAKG